MIYAAGRSTELPELGQIRHQFAAKYGEAGVFSSIMSAQEERRRRQRHKKQNLLLGYSEWDQTKRDLLISAGDASCLTSIYCFRA